MKIKLTQIKPKFTNKFVIIVSCMHGDADAYTDEEYVCKDEADFIRIMSAPECEHDSCSNEDVYRSFCTDLFGDDFIPFDVVYQDSHASIESVEGFYYDVDGVKSEATL